MTFVAWGSRVIGEGNWVYMDIRPIGNVQADVLHIPCRSGSLEKIELHHVLEHLDPRKAGSALEECFRVLCPGGILDVAVPDMVKC